MLQDAAGRGLKIQSPCPFGEREGDEEYVSHRAGPQRQP